MKRIIMSLTIMACCSAAMAQNGNPKNATVKLEEGLTPIAFKNFQTAHNGEEVAMWNLRTLHCNDAKVITKSGYEGNDFVTTNGGAPFFSMLINAYAKHRGVVISPDDMWMLISQQFAYYAKNHSEILRKEFVDHEGKEDIVVKANGSYDSKDLKWDQLIGVFADSVSSKTRNELANLMTANFSTTTPSAKVASQITLMNTVEDYFDFTAINISCGIPTVTIEGTPDDWHNVLVKTQTLARYGMSPWVYKICPLLSKFIEAAEGHGTPEFWRNMMITVKPQEVRGSGCGRGNATVFDGWMMNFFYYDKEGKETGDVTVETEMLSELTPVNIKFVDVNATGDAKTTELQLVSGFTGFEEKNDKSLKARIGWMVIKPDHTKEIQEMKENADTELPGIRLRIKKVPETLKLLNSIRALHLDFIGEVDIPDWLFTIGIEKLEIKGKISKDQKKNILEHCSARKIMINNKEIR